MSANVRCLTQTLFEKLRSCCDYAEFLYKQSNSHERGWNLLSCHKQVNGWAKQSRKWFMDGPQKSKWWEAAALQDVLVFLTDRTVHTPRFLDFVNSPSIKRTLSSMDTSLRIKSSLSNWHRATPDRPLALRRFPRTTHRRRGRADLGTAFATSAVGPGGAHACLVSVAEVP